MKGEGAIVFLIVFIIGLAITLGNSTIPPGRDIYNMLNVPETDYPVLGIAATTLVIGVFNGVVYGIVVWLIFTIISAATGRRKKEQTTIQQTVNVQVQDKAKEARVQEDKEKKA